MPAVFRNWMYRAAKALFTAAACILARASAGGSVRASSAAVAANCASTARMASSDVGDGVRRSSRIASRSCQNRLTSVAVSTVSLRASSCAADRDNATSYRQIVTPTDAAITATTATLTAAIRRADSQYRSLAIPCALPPPITPANPRGAAPRCSTYPVTAQEHRFVTFCNIR